MDHQTKEEQQGKERNKEEQSKIKSKRRRKLKSYRQRKRTLTGGTGWYDSRLKTDLRTYARVTLCDLGLEGRLTIRLIRLRLEQSQTNSADMERNQIQIRLRVELLID
ncbi:PREDICTED: uncharacterized protein LOC101300953 [Fragaria vesca subsp. vesca]